MILNIRYENPYTSKEKKNYRVMIAWVVSLAESFTIPDAERLCWLDDGLLKMGRTTGEKIKR